MFIRRILTPFLYCETPDPGSGGAGGVTPAPGAVDPGTAPATGDSQFWGLFPNVPEDQRSALEPHLRAVQSEVGRLQEAHAPFRDMNPQEVQGLVQFDANFRSNPVGTWMDMAKMMQDQGAIHADLDLETLLAVATGQEVADDEAAVETGGLEGLDPAVAAHIQRLQARVDEFDQRDQQRTVQQQTQLQDRLLETQKGRMKAALVKAGYPEGLLTDELLISSIIAHRGLPSKAVETLLAQRNEILKGFTQTRTEPDPDLNVAGGGPTTPPVPKPSIRDAGDPFAKARVGATSRLRRANRDAAQG